MPSLRHALAPVAALCALALACAPARSKAPSPAADSAVAVPAPSTSLPPREAAPVDSSAAASAAAPRDSVFSKHLEFAILEDYDKGADLADVERDFRLFRELGIRTWRGSFGWDDYEPSRGRYDFAWLHRFADLAARDGITLRPYLGYTPGWAAMGRRADGNVWNDPPARAVDFARFAGRLAAALRRHGNVASYEIYNEENTRFWWDGTAAEYAGVFVPAADSVRAADPRAAVVMGGMVWPDAAWAETVCAPAGHAAKVDAVPVHVYSETWTPDSVTLERSVADLAGRDFVEALDVPCGGAALWANEIGFATAHGKTERQQADWWARAIAALAAAPRVALIGVYEIKDLKPGSAVIGEPENFHLGITRVDRTPKLAFHTVKLLVGLLGADFTVADARLRVVARGPNGAPLSSAPPPEAHLFVRPDGGQLLVAWVGRGGAPVTVDVELPRCGASATSYALDGRGTSIALASGVRLRELTIAPGDPRIVAVAPARSQDCPRDVR